MNLIRELRARRVPQFTSAYVVGGFGLVQFLEFLEGRMELSPHLVNLIALGLVLLLPSVVMLAWSLGRPGRDTLGRTEKFAVPANLLAAAVLLFVLFQGKELGAVTRTIEVEDEHGAVSERVVPKSEFRRRLMLFYPTNTGSATDDWAREASILLISSDLGQDIFLDLAIPFNMVNALREAGHENGHGLSRPLMRKIARDAHYAYFSSGTLRRKGESWHLSLELHESESGRRVSTRDHTGADLMELADLASRRLREDLGIPAAHIDKSPDLPASELCSADMEALKGLAEGIVKCLHRNDWEGAVAPLEDAVARDPGFALAQFLLFNVYQTVGRNEESAAAMRAAMDNLYRVPERTGFMIKSSYYYNIEQDADKAMAVLEMWSRIYPNDVQAVAQQGLYHRIRQDLPAALAAYKRILEIDPTQYGYLEQISDLHTQLGNHDEAERCLRRYVELFPSRAGGYVDLAEFYRDTGRLDEARDNLERARLLEPGDIDLDLRLIELDLRLGRYAASREALDAALDRAETARERARIGAHMIEFAVLTGRGAEVAEGLAVFHRNLCEVQNPLQVDFAYALIVPALTMVGRPQEAIDLLDETATRLPVPFDGLTGIGRAWALADMGRPDEARPELTRAAELVDTYKFETIRPALLLAMGRTDEAEGGLESAVETYRTALETALQKEPVYHLSLARAQRLLPDPDGARETLEAFLDLYPAHPEAHLEMARLLVDRGKGAQAREHLATARAAWTEADPGYGPAVEAARLATILEQTP
jgi:tetratricopeptide (TPR) repeat protein